ncbi:MAG: alkaline phosphatase family protein [Desulfobacterales bacterium]|nr:alkaline phosphatase family protein [Desulfobacterales bacterium]
MGDLTSVDPPLSAPAWASVYTGVGPGIHGIVDFVYIANDFRLRPYGFVNDRPLPLVWDLLCKAGLKTIVINPPMVYPAYKLDGVLVSGWPGPRLSTYPKRLNELVRKTQYRIDIDDPRTQFQKDARRALRELAQVTRARVNLAIQCMESFADWDFFFIVFTSTDRAQHYAIGRANWQTLLHEIYSEIDRFLLRSFEEIASSNGALVLVSDHGFQPVKKTFLMNSWLFQNGFLAAELCPKHYAFSFWRKVYGPRTSVILDKMNRLFSKDRLGDGYRDVDFDHTIAFAGGSNADTVNVWLSDERFCRPALENRKSNAIGQERMLKHLSSKLMNLKTSDGEVLIRDIRVPAITEKASGVGQAIEPNLVVKANRGYTIDVNVIDPLNSLIAPSVYRHGEHDSTGVLGIYIEGNAISQGTRINSVSSVVDIAPAIMRFFDLPTPSWMSVG